MINTYVIKNNIDNHLVEDIYNKLKLQEIGYITQDCFDSLYVCMSIIVDNLANNDNINVKDAIASLETINDLTILMDGK